MTKKNIIEASKIVNDYIDSGKEILLEDTYTKELLSLVDKQTLMELGCSFVSSFRNYMELPYKCIPESRIKAVILLSCGEQADLGE